MDARMRRYAAQSSPERTKVWAEPPPKHQPQQQQQGRKVAVVYYLCRNRHLEHPHFIEVPLSSPEGLYLRDVIDRLNVLRGKKMAAMYSWSCKRSYKNGFVWHDLSEDDLILPAQGNEYVLKGSEILDQSPPDRNDHTVSNAKLHNPKHPLQDSSICYKGQEASCPPSSAVVLIKEAKLPQPTLPPAAQEDDLSPPMCRSSSSGNVSPELGGRTTSLSPISSPKPSEYKISKPLGAQDASTQTEDRGRRNHGLSTRISGVSTDDRAPEVQQSRLQSEQKMCVTEEDPEIVKVASPPTTTSSDSSSSCAKMNTLEYLIREEVSKRNNYRNVEEEDAFNSSESKFKAANMLMHLITCGSISVKDHYGFGFVPNYRPRLNNDVKFTSPMFANSMVLGEISCLQESQRQMGLRQKKKGSFSGSMIETNKYKEGTGEGVSDLKRSSSFDEDRNYNTPYSRRSKEKEDSAQLKNFSQTMKIQSSKLSTNAQNETVVSQISNARHSSAGLDVYISSPLQTLNDGSKRTIDYTTAKGSSMRLESFREVQEKVIKIEERLTSGARVIIKSRSPCEDIEDGPN